MQVKYRHSAKRSKTIQYLKASWTHLPEDTQRTIAGKNFTQDFQLITAGNTATSPANRLRSSRSSSRPPQKRKRVADTQIILSDSVSTNLSDWVENPSKFFLDLDIGDVKFGAPPLIFLYQMLLHLECRRENDLIRSRFLKVLFYKLKQKLGVQRLHSRSLDIITKIISESGLMKHDREKIKSNIGRWSNEGKKIDLLCRDIDENPGTGHRYLGIIFCLPKNVGKE